RARPSAKMLALRTCLIGADRIAPETLERTVEAFGGRGLRGESLTPAYGLAEATLAVTVADLHRPPKSIVVDGQALYDGDVRTIGSDAFSARRIVSCGQPLPSTTVRVDDGGDGTGFGEIIVRSPSAASGYLGNPEETSRAFL